MNDNKKITVNDIEDILCVLNLVKNKSQIDSDTELFGNGVGLDSIEVLQIVSSIEEKFDITIEDEDLLPERFMTVGSLVTFVEEYF